MHYQHIDRVAGLTRESFLRKYGFPHLPALITDLTGDWAAMERWTPDFFRSKLGDTPVTVHRSRARDEKNTFSFSDFLDYMGADTDEDPYYLADWHFRSEYSWLCDDYQAPEFFANWLDRLPAEVAPDYCWLYIGPAGSGTVMHQDTMMTSAWTAVISGQKRWLYYPPDQGKYLYFGAVDAFKPDLDNHPLFAQACAPLECVQKAGEVVFTPSGWWHQVVNEKPGIALTENFVNESNMELAREKILGKFDHFALKFHIPELYGAKRG